MIRTNNGSIRKELATVTRETTIQSIVLTIQSRQQGRSKQGIFEIFHKVIRVTARAFDQIPNREKDGHCGIAWCTESDDTVVSITLKYLVVKDSRKGRVGVDRR
jgi:hypothetical protein